MSNLFLCGHTGSDNRGCEAIVRSTVDLFARHTSSPFYLATFAFSQDERCGLDKKAELIKYNNYKSQLSRAWCAFRRKVLKDTFAGQDIIQKALWDKIEAGDLCLTIGGDTYCYGVPTVSMAQNLYARKKGAVSVLWCCTLDKSKLKGEVLKDIKSYDLIVAREQLTAELLEDIGVPKDKIIKCCDPAFTLEVKEHSLPYGFLKGNTLGINLSNLVDTPQVLCGVEYLSAQILEKTNMNLCLVPHVYNSKDGTGDIAQLKALKERLLPYEDRISVVDEDLTCSELKYIISNCRFFVGARTHSTIAAYSTGVPTLVLGYSPKSKGIAVDLFSSFEDFVLPFDEVKNKEDIYVKFKYIMENEEKIKTLLSKKVLEYKETVEDTVKMLYERYLAET